MYQNVPSARSTPPSGFLQVRFGLRNHACEPTVLPTCHAAVTDLGGTSIAFHGLYSPSPTGFGARLVAVGYAANAKGRFLAGTLTSASRVPIRPSLSRLIGLTLTAAEIGPRETDEHPLTIFSHFRHPDYDELRGASPAFTPALPPPNPLGFVALRLRVPFGPSQVYAIDAALVDTGGFLKDLRQIEDFIAHFRVPIVGVTPEERADPAVLRVQDPARLFRFAAQQAELVLFAGCIRASAILSKAHESHRIP